ncbi:Fanconi anemia group F protein [Platysternon megacephalum]|uniref:Fanconi anemia group F protein n=1 Tax=Platysternon megacephalum TaxID=55544 RepID=A0A4D9DEN0_9SAUR|nr:Fanconi anemia group F protein [Platysternon megacephalum]
MAPLLLLLWLGSALCARELVPKQCLLGPEFWCRDPGTAAQCGQQQDCKFLEQPMSQGWHVREQALSIKCTICTRILKKLKSMVGDDPDEDSIGEAENKLCGVVGRALRRLCRYVIKKFKPKITAALQDGQDPKEICISLRMCRESPPSQGGLVPPSDDCDLCLTFTSLAQPDLQHVRPGWDLGDVLNGTCKQHFGGSPRPHAGNALGDAVSFLLRTQRPASCRRSLPKERPALAPTPGHGREARARAPTSTAGSSPRLLRACLPEGTVSPHCSPQLRQRPRVCDGWDGSIIASDFRFASPLWAIKDQYRPDVSVISTLDR